MAKHKKSRSPAAAADVAHSIPHGIVQKQTQVPVLTVTAAMSAGGKEKNMKSKNRTSAVPVRVAVSDEAIRAEVREMVKQLRFSPSVPTPDASKKPQIAAHAESKHANPKKTERKTSIKLLEKESKAGSSKQTVNFSKSKGGMVYSGSSVGKSASAREGTARHPTAVDGGRKRDQAERMQQQRNASAPNKNTRIVFPRDDDAEEGVPTAPVSSDALSNATSQRRSNAALDQLDSQSWHSSKWVLEPALKDAAATRDKQSSHTASAFSFD